MSWQMVFDMPESGDLFDVSLYCGYFHDGGVIDIEHFDNTIEISMYSSEVEEDEVGGVLLSKEKRIKGRLHLEKISTIKVNSIELTGKLHKEFDSGDIFNFEIVDGKMTLSVDWINFSQKPHLHVFSKIEIEAEKIWWENIPDLDDPFW